MSIKDELEGIAAKVDAFMAENRDEFKAIEQVEDYEQQGYLAAPMLARCTGICPAELISIVMECSKEDLHPVSRLRDSGILRWCREQIIGSGTLQ